MTNETKTIHSAMHEVIDFTGLSPEQIRALLAQYRLGLTVDEALTIQQQLLKRPPTLSECILWSIQGSEHCSYKSSRKYLKTLTTTGSNVILGAKEDAGIVAVARDAQGERFGIVVSHESHNHPSQVVPYEGAATGVGGNVRDVSCMGAEVIAIADGLRFGDLQRSQTHWIADEVVAGIAGYGNPLGVPNIAGDVYFDPGYNENCLVTVVTLGCLAESDIIHSYVPPVVHNLAKNGENYVFILVGKPTDNSGFGGASFASTALDADKTEQNKGAVQEPNAFLERHLLKANQALFQILKQRKLLDQVGFKDLGAGGVACASVELADSGGVGAEINVDAIPVSMSNLSPAVILCSETQERFMWVVPQELQELILQHYNVTFALPEVSAGARAAVIGRVRMDGQYRVRQGEHLVIDAKASDITRGLLYDRAVKVAKHTWVEPHLPAPSNYSALLLQLLAHENIASRAPLFERYDKQVQGRTVLEAGEADAGVMQPFNEEKYPSEIRKVGIALSLDQNPRYGRIDAYWGAVNAVIEAARNVAAVGAIPVALTDCLCFGNPENPEQMGELVAAIEGIKAACAAIGDETDPKHPLPIIAGNVSLYNEASNGRSIPPSPMISVLGRMPDVSCALTMHLQRNNSWLFMLGLRRDECGGGVYYALNNECGAQLPQPDLTTVGVQIRSVAELIQQKLVLSCHDISDGGLAVAVAEMSFRNGIGVKIAVEGSLAPEKKLFSETGGFILEVTPEHRMHCEELLLRHAVDYQIIGHTQALPRLQMQDVIDVEVMLAKQTWMNGLRDKL